MKHRELIHLYHRVSFGVDISSYNDLINKKRKDVVDFIFSQKSSFQKLIIDFSEIYSLFEKNYRLTEEDKIKIRDFNRIKNKDLNDLWIERLASDENPFLEKMTLFWANVFVCKDPQTLHILQYNNTLRKHALGNFGDFVKAIAREPSMSKYLNNRVNSKSKPNENFARELMELFTLGEGNYSEKDIKEAARAFTGWKYYREGTFKLDRSQHDYGLKTFFGKSGNFDGDDIIDIILEQKQCASFICEKIYKFFVNPRLNKSHLNEMVDIFYKNYDIKSLMRHIFMSDWFYNEENIGSKIKSPIELLVGIKRTVPFEFEKQNELFFVQKVLGQNLLYPPNVAGWKGDKSWIDSNSLMFRMKLPSLILNESVINISEKGEFEDSFEEYYKKDKNKERKIKTVYNWDSFYKQFAQITTKSLKDFLIVSKIDKDTETLLSDLNIKSKKNHCIKLMSILEYQLC